jgi:hypothetical protein
MRHYDPFALITVAKDVVLLLISLGGAAWAWFRIRHAHSWPSTHGTIMSATVKSARGYSFQPWVADFIYSYVANGEYYSGVYRIRARSERRADEKVAGWKGRIVVVRYSPDQQDFSTVLKSDQPGGQLGN